MTDQKKPEALVDEDLEAAQGGVFIESWINNVKLNGDDVGILRRRGGTKLVDVSDTMDPEFLKDE